MAAVATPAPLRRDRISVGVSVPEAGALTMTPFLAAHAASYAALRVHPLTGRYLPPAPDASEATKIARRLVAASRSEWRARGLGLWAVFAAPDHFVGTCGLIWIEQLERCELSFLFDPRWWGKGVARACVGAALNHADETAPDLRIFALTHQDNRPARRLLDATGLSFRRNLSHAGLPAAYFERCAGGPLTLR
jgi:RimJ/RimL family protein N-acetyltransferase